MLLEGQSNIKNINKAGHADGEEKIKKDDEPQLMGQVKTARNDIIGINVKWSSDLSLQSRVAILNADQWRIFDVKTHLLHQQ